MMNFDMIVHYRKKESHMDVFSNIDFHDISISEREKYEQDMKRIRNELESHIIPESYPDLSGLGMLSKALQDEKIEIIATDSKEWEFDDDLYWTK